MVSINLQTPEEKFQADRQGFIGGSDIHHLFNLEPYGCELKLYRIKTGELPDLPFHGNRATRRGTNLEDMAAEVYAEETGRQIRRVTPKRDSIFPILRPQPDREIVNDERGPGILSIKVPGKETFLRLKRAILAVTSAERATEASEFDLRMAEAGRRILYPYALQLQAELAAFGRSWGSFGFFHADGWEIAFLDLRRDNEAIAAIRERAYEFWDKVLAKTPPLQLSPSSRQCSRCEYRLSCQEGALQELITEQGHSEVAKVPALDNLVEELRHNEDLEEEAHDLVEQGKDRIRQLLADADAGEGRRTRAYNRLQAGRRTVQREPLLKFLQRYAEVADEIMKDSAAGPALTPRLADLIEHIVFLPETVEEKFVNKGKPFRVLRIYDLPQRG